MNTYRFRILLPLILFLVNSCSEQSELQKLLTHKPEDSISLIAVGDIMLGGTAEEILNREDYDYPFKYVKKQLSEADIVIGNLEGPITSNCENPVAKEYTFRSPADKVAPALKKAGFNILNLANNHILDYGEEGMQDTINALHQQGIASVGVGINLEQARAGTIMKTPHGDIGFLSYSLTFPEAFWATKNKPGTAFGHEQQIRDDLQRLKKQTGLVIVSFHWGREKTTELRPYQPKLGRTAIDAGAAVVLGHHPHVLQAIEKYNDGLIIYSLGNFVFGSYSQEAKHSVIAEITLHKNKFHSAKFTPINVLNTEVIFQPKILSKHAANSVIEHLNQLSSSSNTRLAQINSQGFLHVDQNKIQSLLRNN